jgi:hypothetical protein
LELSLWNFNIMLPIKIARMGLLFGTFWCTVCPIGGALWKHKNCDYSFNNKRNFTKFLLYAYLVRIHDISCNFFIRIICTAPHPKWYLAHPWIHTHSGGHTLRTWWYLAHPWIHTHSGGHTLRTCSFAVHLVLF